MLSPELITTAGGHVVNAHTQVSWSLGEAVTETAVAGAFQLTQGFHQTYAYITALDEPIPGLVMHVYPNPTTGLLYMDVVEVSRSFSLVLYDQTGRLLYSEGVQPGVGRRVLDISVYPPGLYLLHLCADEGKTAQSFKIIKHN